MKKIIEHLEEFLEWGGVKKDITLLVISGIALLLSIFKVIPGLPFDISWVAIILCGIPIILEAVIGLVTAFDIKADVIVSLALTAAVITWLVTGQPIRAVTILVVFCPCSLVFATPTAIMAAIGNATKHGFLVKEGDALERMAKEKRITFDKTGTLTVRVPKGVAAKSVNEAYSDEEIYTFVASVEKNSEHPLGKAIVNCFRSDIGKDIPKTSDFAMIPGQGVKAVINGKTVCAGNERLIASEHIGIPDIVRSEAAGEIAREVGIKDVSANCLPEDKLKIIDSYQKNNELVCMIGDGVNDAPALKIATVGIAMGGVGSDIAVDAADIALVDDDIKELPHLFALSRRMMVKIKFNLSFSMLLNFIAIVLAMTGILNPVIGALVHNAGSVFVIINSAFLLKWRKSK